MRGDGRIDAKEVGRDREKDDRNFVDFSIDNLIKIVIFGERVQNGRN